jgi:hypothetical protein
MYNFTLAYLENVEKQMIENKNRFGLAKNILLVAQNENIFGDICFHFTTSDSTDKIYHLLNAITSLAIATHPSCGTIKKKLLLDNLLSSIDYIKNIRFHNIETKNLIVFASEAWEASQTDDEKLENLSPKERPDRSEIIMTAAYEHGSDNTICRVSEIKKQGGIFLLDKPNTSEGNNLSGNFNEILKHDAFKILNDIDFPEQLAKAFKRNKNMKAKNR